MTFLNELRWRHDPGSRFTSIEHWHDYFQDDQEQGATGFLSEEDP